MNTQSGKSVKKPTHDSEEEFQDAEIVEYNLGDRVGPQLFQEYVDDNARGNHNWHKLGKP